MNIQNRTSFSRNTNFLSRFTFSLICMELSAPKWSLVLCSCAELIHYYESYFFNKLHTFHIKKGALKCCSCRFLQERFMSVGTEETNTFCGQSCGVWGGCRTYRSNIPRRRWPSVCRCRTCRSCWRPTSCGSWYHGGRRTASPPAGLCRRFSSEVEEEESRWSAWYGGGRWASSQPGEHVKFKCMKQLLVWVPARGNWFLK